MIQMALMRDAGMMQTFRFGATGERKDRLKNDLHFFHYRSRKLTVTCSVNPQVPGSSPGRGASITKPCSDAGLFYRLNFNSVLTRHKQNGTLRHFSPDHHPKSLLGALNATLEGVMSYIKSETDPTLSNIPANQTFGIPVSGPLNTIYIQPTIGSQALGYHPFTYSVCLSRQFTFADRKVLAAEKCIPTSPQVYKNVAPKLN
jgi:hypothetical protein